MALDGLNLPQLVLLDNIFWKRPSVYVTKQGNLIERPLQLLYLLLVSSH